MRKLLFAVFLAAGLKYSSEIQSSPPTPPVKERLKFLKWQLKEEIGEKQKKFSIIPPEDDYDILDATTKADLRSRLLMTPVSRLRKRKLRNKERKRLTTISTTDATTASKNIDSLRETIDNSSDSSSDNSTEDMESIQLRMQQLKVKALKWAQHLKKYGTPIEIFYRRDSKQPMTEAEIRQRHMLHCVDLLRPILLGLKKNITQLRTHGEQVVNRLIQLLSYGGTGQTGDEIRAILLQINNLQIRFFQWDVDSIKKFFNFIMPGQKHSFKSLKHGVKRMLLTVWKMDLSDTNQLIKESRMFRPPCVGSSQGSTRSSKATRYTTESKPKSTCAPKDKKCLLFAQNESDDDK